jgi:hypothetical protein
MNTSPTLVSAVPHDMQPTGFAALRLARRRRMLTVRRLVAAKDCKRDYLQCLPNAGKAPIVVTTNAP